MRWGEHEEAAMQVTKLRVANELGPVPAGRYFEQLAQNLRVANAANEARRAREEAREEKLEARYRRASASRAGPTLTHRAYEQHAMM
jgi:hypothetical protein